MNTTPKLNGGDGIKEAVIKLADGNVGALTTCVKLALFTETCDPDAMMGPYTPLLSLDSLGIYGERIWLLYKDICGESCLNTLTILRAHQLGFLSTARLITAIDSCRTSNKKQLDPQKYLKKVQERLPKFGREEEKNEV